MQRKNQRLSAVANAPRAVFCSHRPRGMHRPPAQRYRRYVMDLPTAPYMFAVEASSARDERSSPSKETNKNHAVYIRDVAKHLLPLGHSFGSPLPPHSTLWRNGPLSTSQHLHPARSSPSFRTQFEAGGFITSAHRLALTDLVDRSTSRHCHVRVTVTSLGEVISTVDGPRAFRMTRWRAFRRTVSGGFTHSPHVTMHDSLWRTNSQRPQAVRSRGLLPGHWLEVCVHPGMAGMVTEKCLEHPLLDAVQDHPIIRPLGHLAYEEEL